MIKASAKAVNHNNSMDIAVQRSIQVADKAHAAEVEADAREDEQRMTAAKSEREETVTDIADRTEAGESLTLAQEKAIDTNPAIRMLIKKVFTERKLDIAEMYVDVLEDSYKIAMGKKKTQGFRTDEKGNVIIVEGIPVREDIKLKHKRLFMNEIDGFAGIHATADDKKRPDQIVNIIVDRGLHIRIKGSNGTQTEIHTVRQARETPLDEAQSEDSNSGVWEKER